MNKNIVIMPFFIGLLILTGCQQVDEKSKVDLSSCNEMIGFYKDNCYKSLAAKNTDFSICNKISDQKIREVCQSQEEILQNPDACEKEQFKAPCYAYAAQHNQNPMLCQKLPKENRDWCFLEVATMTNELSVCENIFQEDMKNYCITLIKAIDDAQNCNNLGSESEYYNKNNCLKFVAIRQKDDKVCNEIIDSIQYRDECYLNLAESIQDPNLCEMVETWQMENDCYSTLIEGKKASFCDKIENNVRKNSCYESKK